MIGCRACKARLVYEKTCDLDQYKAHERLHKKGCPYRAAVKRITVKRRKDDSDEFEIVGLNCRARNREGGEVVLPLETVSMDYIARHGIPLWSRIVE